MDSASKKFLKGLQKKTNFSVKKKFWSYYCPQCKTERRITLQPRPTFKHVLQVFLTAIIFMFACWSWFEWKGILAFFPIWIVFEISYRAIIRTKLYCELCGFDPYLYLIDVPKARKEVENFWRKKYADQGVAFPGDENKPSGANVTNPADSDELFIDENQAHAVNLKKGLVSHTIK